MEEYQDIIDKGSRLLIDDDLLIDITKSLADNKLGARGLNTKIAKYFDDILYDLEDHKDDDTVIINKEGIHWSKKRFIKIEEEKLSNEELLIEEK